MLFVSLGEVVKGFSQVLDSDRAEIDLRGACVEDPVAVISEPVSELLQSFGREPKLVAHDLSFRVPLH